LAVHASGGAVDGVGFTRKAGRFRGGLVFKAQRLLFHSTPGSRVIKKKEKKVREGLACGFSFRSTSCVHSLEFAGQIGPSLSLKIGSAYMGCGFWVLGSGM
jgi:hypothetical protein